MTLLQWLLLAPCIVGFFFCCCAVNCAKCETAAPAMMRVVISGLASSGCADCASLDGTYDCALDPAFGGDCRWVYNFPAFSPCGAADIIVYPSPPGYPGFIAVSLGYNVPAAPTNIEWKAYLGISSGIDNIDCDLSGTVANDTTGFTIPCDGSSSTATLTAIP